MSFEFVAVGNWWSEYRCTECGKHVVVNDEDSKPKACPHCGAPDHVPAQRIEGNHD